MYFLNVIDYYNTVTLFRRGYVLKGIYYSREQSQIFVMLNWQQTFASLKELF